VSTPRPGDVLRALAKAATEPYQPQKLSQAEMIGGYSAPSMSVEAIVAQETARTCAHSFSRALLAVADLFDSAAPVTPEQMR
jgi:hypothetical protein